MKGLVKTWMTAHPVAIDPGASALAALESMVERGIRHLPVVEAGRVVGVISINDLRAALPVPVSLLSGISVGDRGLVRDYAVGEVMTHFPEVAHPETSLEDAAQRMADRRIGCLPVVDGQGRIVGMLSSTDALRALATSLWAKRAHEDETREDELSGLLAELSDERTRIERQLESCVRSERELAVRVREDGIDEEERSEEEHEIGLTDRLRELAAGRLAAIDRALAHAAEGVLTLCDLCGGNIPIARLRALPGTTCCVACAQEKENRA
ncbi:MAG TPA: CBS domain-containing protein [Myxococcota bacterium]|nr:CBS domain-containing protein [Myxococcota bacterium]